MVGIKSMDVRWIWRYRLFCTAGIIIMIVQIFIAFIFFTISDETDVGFRDRRNANENNYVPKNNENNQINDVYEHTYVDVKLNKLDVVKFEYTSLNLSLADLEFTPVCDVTSKDAISAIKRAKTRSCKQLIANVSCLNRLNKLYPQNLPHMCPIDGGQQRGRSLGCYRGNFNARILSGAYYNYSSLNTVEYCLNKCVQAGFSYAGVQFSDECYCGNDKPSQNFRVGDSLCDLKCAGNLSQVCGGYFATSIFETGVAKFIAQVPNEPVKIIEKQKLPTRVVYLLTLNGRAVRQVYRLIRFLFHADHFFFIHVDARQDYMFRELLSLELHFPNIRLLRHRYDTIWGGASLLVMLLHAMSELIKSSWNWDFVINLSESDFPIKTNEDLVSFLNANSNRNFVKSHGRDVQHFILKQGLDKTFVECDERMWRVSDRTLPSGIVIDGGSDWIALSKPFVKYMLTNQHTELLTGLNTLFTYTLLPAETYFHTVLRNTEFCKTYVDNNLHITNWKRHLGCKCQYKHVVDWCGCSPNAFTSDDWHKIQNTKAKRQFFARKFEPVVCQSILDKIEKWLYPRKIELTNEHGYWQNMYHYADSSPPVDDALFTIGASLSRISLKLMKRNGKCHSFDTSNLLQIHSYYRYDQQLGILIEYGVSLKFNNATSLRLETWFNMLPQYRIIKPDNIFGSRLISMSVNSNYDTKEQISRNFAKAIGPFTDSVVLIFQVLSSSESSNVTFVWINPLQMIVDVTKEYIEEQPAVHHVKPNLILPLLPGVWRVNIVCNNETVAQSKFLVTPVEISSAVHAVDRNELQNVSKVFENYKTVHDQWSYLLSDVGENKPMDFINTLVQKSQINSQKTGLGLKNLIDSLVVKFYQLVDSCVTDRRTKIRDDCDLVETVACRSTSWSSFSPDPKSDVMSLALNQHSNR